MGRKAGGSRVKIKGSEKRVLADAKVLGAAPRGERIEVTVILRRRAQVPKALFAAATGPVLRARRYLRDGELRERFGADPAHLEKLEAFAHHHGLDVVRASRAERSVRLSGSVAAMEKAFGVKLRTYRRAAATYRGRSGAVHVPSSLSRIVVAVLGLDSRAQARVPSPARRRQRRGATRARATSFTPAEVAKLYEFPPGRATGQCIGIIELDGGYRKVDLDRYFDSLGLAPPQVSAVSVLGGHNQPAGTPLSFDLEVMLDIEVAGAAAPGAKIVVYFAPNTDDGFLGALSAAVHDSVRRPSVISASWGNPEKAWTRQSIAAFEEICRDAALLGVTVCAPSGDHGSADEDPPRGRGKNVDYPASSPHVLGCGGTVLFAERGKIVAERVWNDGNGTATGGGVSRIFGAPSWQRGIAISKSRPARRKAGRGVPDVAAHADSHGYRIRVDGTSLSSGGTSAVVPLWAALIARLNQLLGRRVGFPNPIFYRLQKTSEAFNDIVEGNNGAYSAHRGWDACSGLGSPNGVELLRSLS